MPILGKNLVSCGKLWDGLILCSGVCWDVLYLRSIRVGFFIYFVVI